MDLIGGTWYVGAPDQREQSFANMQAYFEHRVDAGRPFALSEIGGRNEDGRGNDAVLRDMMAKLQTLAAKGISFKYATFFLGGAWGTDATLAFVNDGGPGLA